MRLTTRRLILRNLRKSDIRSIVKNANNLNVSKYLLAVSHPYKLKDAKWWVKECSKEIKIKPRKDYTFAIELKSEKTFIGGVGIHKINKFQGTAEVGYWLGEDYWRQGIMSEALKRVIKFAFKKLKLRRLEAGVFVENKLSFNLLKKFRFRFEGIKRKSHRAKATGKVHDTYTLGLLGS